MARMEPKVTVHWRPAIVARSVLVSSDVTTVA
jgi:hypothetical protein